MWLKAILSVTPVFLAAPVHFWGGYCSFRQATNHSLNIDVYNGGTVKAAWTVLQDGKVGIGTTSPAHKLSLLDGAVGAFINPRSATSLVAMGSNTAHALQIYSGGDERIRVKTDGNVGIGTNAPATKLDVYGHLNLRNSYNLTWGGEYGANIPTIVGVSGGSGYLAIYPAGSTSGEKFRITNEGKVGIWSTAPGGYLSVEGTGNHRGIFVAATGATTYAAIQAEANALTTGSVGRFSSNSASTSTRYLVNIINDNAAATAAVGLRIQQDSTAPALIALGNVGIGTASPSTKLHVNGGLTSGADDDNRALFGYTAPRFYIGTRQSGTNYLDTVSVTSGKVGIGTTSPTNDLQVGSIGASNFNGNHFAFGNGTKACAFFQSNTFTNIYSSIAYKFWVSGTEAIRLIHHAMSASGLMRRAICCIYMEPPLSLDFKIAQMASLDI